MVITGIIRPPPEIRAAADKTASFIASKGRAFEARIRNSAKGKSPRFAFLHETSPFHAYYEDRIRFYEQGGDDNTENETADKNQEETIKQKSTEEEKKVEPTDQKEATTLATDLNISKTNQTTKSFKASALDPVARALLKQRQKITSEREASIQKAKDMANPETCQPVPDENDNDDDSNKVNGITAPPIFQFVNLSAPSNCTPEQLEVMKLVAQMTALHNISKEHTKIQDPYSTNNEESFLKELARREWNNPSLGFVQPRHASFAYFTALVDCYKEIILFSKKESTSKSTTACLEEAAYRAEFDRDVREQLLEKNSNDGQHNLGGSAYMDWHDFVVVETIDFPVDEVVAMLPPPPPPSSLISEKKKSMKQQTLAEENVVRDDDDMQESSDEEMEEDKEEIRIDPTYQPRVVSSQATMQNPSRTHVVDPISGKSIPLDQMSEHLRIQLLDPKWAEEKKKFQDKQKESNLGGDIARNITAFVGKKRDSDTMLGGRGSATVTNTPSSNPVGAAEQTMLIQRQPHPTIPSTTVGVMPGMIPAGMPPGMNVTVPLPPLPALPAASSTTIPMPPHPTMLPPLMPGIYPPPLPLGVPPSISGTNEAAVVDANGMPIAKKQRLDDPSVKPSTNISEDNLSSTQQVESAAPPISPKEFPAISQVEIRIPSSSSNPSWNLNGQTISLASIPSSITIKQIKERLRERLGDGMPLNKMQLKDNERGAFLKDGLFLKDCGVGFMEQDGQEDLVVLDLVPKVRGGRK